MGEVGEVRPYYHCPIPFLPLRSRRVVGYRQDSTVHLSHLFPCRECVNLGVVRKMISAYAMFMMHMFF